MKVTIEQPKERLVNIQMLESEALLLKELLYRISTDDVDNIFGKGKQSDETYDLTFKLFELIGDKL